MIRLYGAKFTENETGRETARRLLACAVLDAWGWTALPGMGKGEYGKPFFLPNSSGRWFNLSHTDGLVLCAISDEGEVGVDIETVKPRREGLPRYVMNDEEFAAFDGTWEDFTRIWTLKEASVKYQGTSVVKARNVPVPPPVPCRSYGGEGWRAALCCSGEPPAEINWVEL